jgi:cysteine desulfurase
MDRIYLDHCATTPVRPEVLEAMLPYLGDRFGNAGSVHAFGRECRKAVDEAREQVAELLHAAPREILFTSGGTEADNLAIRGMVAVDAHSQKNIVVSAVEHHAVLHAAEYVERHDAVIVRIAGVDSHGLIDTNEVAGLIDRDTLLVSVMHANNETGAIQPVQLLAELCAERGIPFHSDAAQSAGKIPIDVRSTPVSLLALAGHKLYAPKGVGALYLRNGTQLVPQALGGSQERGRRAGTENVAGIVALGKACELAKREMAQTGDRLRELRDLLQNRLLEAIPDTFVNGPLDHRLPHVLNMTFRATDGESIVLGLDTEGIAVSAGATCTAGAVKPSHVLHAMGLTSEDARCAIRFSLGLSNTRAQIERVFDILSRLVRRLRATA